MKEEKEPEGEERRRLGMGSDELEVTSSVSSTWRRLSSRTKVSYIASRRRSMTLPALETCYRSITRTPFSTRMRGFASPPCCLALSRKAELPSLHLEGTAVIVCP